MSQTAVFRRRVRDAMGPPPMAAAAEESAGELVRRLAEAGASAVVIAEAGGRAIGILTEQGVARRMAFRADPAAPAAAFMSAPVETVGEDEPLYHAIARMRRAGRRHIPAIDSAGRAVGMLSLDAALADASTRLLSQIDRLTHDRTVPGMAAARAAQAEVAGELLADGAAGPEVQAWLSDFNNDLHARIARLLLTDGAPPVPFGCW